MRSARITAAVTAALVLSVGATSAEAAFKPKPATKKSVTALSKKLAEVGKTVATLKADVDGFKTIAQAAPAIVSGLTQLKDGLTLLGDAYQSVEYGVAQVGSSSANLALINPPAFSADIPDDGNGTTASGDAILIAELGAPTTTVNVRVLVRSNESDREGIVGQVNTLLTVTGPNGPVACQNGQYAATGGVALTPAGEPIQTPSGPSTSLRLVNILGGVGRTDQALPADGAPGSSPALPSGCTFASSSGQRYQVHFDATFFDIPTTTTPGPMD